MRKIKFRGIAIYGKDFIFGSLIVNINEAGRKEFFIKQHIGKVQVREETVGQLIGQNDINKEEVYEGDIVSTSTRKWVIEYREDAEFCGFLPVEIGKEDNHLSIFTRFDVLEVIGNVYQNQDLIKEKR